MRILRLQITDFMRVTAMEMEFTEAGLVEVAGRNGQGKSSAIAALIWAIGGPRALPDIDEPIRFNSIRRGLAIG